MRLLARMRRPARRSLEGCWSVGFRRKRRWRGNVLPAVLEQAEQSNIRAPHVTSLLCCRSAFLSYSQSLSESTWLPIGKDQSTITTGYRVTTLRQFIEGRQGDLCCFPVVSHTNTIS